MRLCPRISPADNILGAEFGSLGAVLQKFGLASLSLSISAVVLSTYESMLQSREVIELNSLGFQLFRN